MAIGLHTNNRVVGVGANLINVPITTTISGTMFIAVSFGDTTVGTVSGGGITWHLISSSAATTAVWWGWLAGTITATNITATFGLNQNSLYEGLSVSVWVGSQNRAPSTTYAAAKSLAKTAVWSNSVIIGCGFSNTGTTIAYVTGCSNCGSATNASPAYTLIHDYYSANITTIGSSYTVGITNGSGTNNELTAVEIFDAGAFYQLPSSGQIGLGGSSGSVAGAFSGGISPAKLGDFYKNGATGYVTSADTAPNVPTSGAISIGNFLGAQRLH